MADLGDRNYSARAYLNQGRPQYGTDIVCLEPQGFLLQFPDLPVERKRAIYSVVKAKTFAPEKIGFRIREAPIFGPNAEGEDGAFWFALEGQMVLGVSTFDKAEAERLLETMSFHNFAKAYPDYTLGRWTNSDSMQSSLHPREGLLNYWKPTLEESGIGYCSHPHSWPLYNYHRIRDARPA
jgi:cellobiose phosphorylase